MRAWLIINAACTRSSCAHVPWWRSGGASFVVLKSRVARAFTLVELLVSMTVLVLLIAMLGQLSFQATSAWTTGESNKDRLQSLRAITDLFSSELQSALLPVDRSNTATGLQLIVDPQTTNPTPFLNKDAIFWQAPVASNQKNGDMAEVGYFVKWVTDSTDPAHPRARLCRFYVDDPTDASHFLIYTQPTAWLANGILDAVCPANNVGGPSGNSNRYQGLFAENVVGLWIKCLDADGLVITKNYSGSGFGSATFDSRQGYINNAGTLKSPSYLDASGTRQPCSALPPAIQISFVVLDSSAAAKVGVAEQTSIMQNAAASPDALTFQTRVQTVAQLNAVRSGMRSFQSTVYLQNGK